MRDRRLLLAVGVGVALGVSAALAVGACGPEDQSGFIVEITAEPDVARELEAVEIVVTTPSDHWTRNYPLGSDSGQFAFPVRLAIDASASADTPIDLEVTGLARATGPVRAQTLVRRQVKTHAVPGLVLLLPILLARECVGVDCRADTCVPSRGCQSPVVDPDSLKPLAPGAGPHVTAADAASPDAGPSAGDAPSSPGDGAYDGPASSWTSLTPAAIPPLWPPPLHAPQMVFDPRGGGLVLIGVSASSEDRLALWQWNPASGIWRERIPADAATPWPRVRWRGEFLNGPLVPMALVSAGERILLVFALGQSEIGTAASAELLWEWDPARGAWTDLTPRPLRPDWPRVVSWVRAAYDETAGDVALAVEVNTAGTGAPSDWAVDLWRSDPRKPSDFLVPTGGRLPIVELATTLDHPGRFDLAWQGQRLVLWLPWSQGGGDGPLRFADRGVGWWDPIWQPYGLAGGSAVPDGSLFATRSVGRFLVVPFVLDRELWHVEGATGVVERTPAQGPSSAGPPARHDPAVAFDRQTGTLFVFGGEEAGGARARLRDLWSAHAE